MMRKSDSKDDPVVLPEAVPEAPQPQPARPKPEPVAEFTIAEIVAPQGLNGEMRALCLTDFPEALGRLTEVIVEGRSRQVMKVRSAHPHGAMLLFQLEGIDNRETAELYRGAYIKIPRSEVVPLGPGHYYISEIIGLEVITEDDRSLGIIQDVRRTGSNDVYCTPKAMIPATREAVTLIDVPNGCIRVNSALVVED